MASVTTLLMGRPCHLKCNTQVPDGPSPCFTRAMPTPGSEGSHPARHTMRGVAGMCRGLAHSPQRSAGSHSPGAAGPWRCWTPWHRADRGCFCPYA